MSTNPDPDPGARALFVIYDERALSGNTDEAEVLCCADTWEEALRDQTEMGYGVIYRYDVVRGDQLVNEVGPLEVR